MTLRKHNSAARPLSRHTLKDNETAGSCGWCLAEENIKFKSINSTSV